MNKTEAAEFLQIGVRTLERYTSSGRVAAQRVKMARGFALDYDPDELAQFKAVLDAEIAAQTEGSPHSPPGSPERDAATPDGQSDKQLATLARSPATLATTQNNTVALVQFIAATVNAMDAQRGAALSEKLFLTLPEAAQLAGVGKSAIEGAIKAGYIKAHSGLGRGRRVKRADVEKWAKAL